MLTGKVSSTEFAVFFIVTALLFFPICFFTQAQTNYTFEPIDKFTIPEYNAVISFSTAGTYKQANLIKGTWHFADLQLNNSQNLEQLQISAQNSNVSITSYRATNATLGSLRLRYVVEGQGTQTLNLGDISRSGRWSVILNGVFVAENNGWKILPDGTLTVTGATANVSVSYYYYPESFDDRSSQPFFEQHSVSILATAAAAITVVLAVAIAIKTRKAPTDEVNNLINNE
jgi:hypothetical protein